MLAALASAVVMLCMGAVRIPIETTWAVLLRHLFGQSGCGIPVSMEQVVWQIRMLRITLSFLAGSEFALCGCAIQAIMQSPTADPYIPGVSAGATLDAMGSLFLGVGVMSGFWVFLGTGLACFLVLALVSTDGRTTLVKLIPAGMIVNALLTAFSNFAIAVVGNSDDVLLIKFWAMGALTCAGWKNIGLIAATVIFTTLCFMNQTRILDGLLLGEKAAVTIGIDTFRCRLAYLLVLSLLTDALIPACGTIDFVGLTTPHLARALVGTAHRRLLPVATFSGGLSMPRVDALAWGLLPNTELPVGISTTSTSTPLFVYVMV